MEGGVGTEDVVTTCVMDGGDMSGEEVEGIGELGRVVEGELLGRPAKAMIWE